MIFLFLAVYIGLFISFSVYKYFSFKKSNKCLTFNNLTFENNKKYNKILRKLVLFLFKENFGYKIFKIFIYFLRYYDNF